MKTLSEQLAELPGPRVLVDPGPTPMRPAFFARALKQLNEEEKDAQENRAKENYSDEVVAWSENFPRRMGEDRERFWIPLILEAYRLGIFPWPQPGIPELPWFCPRERCILRASQLQRSTRDARGYRNSPYAFTVQQASAEVLSGCATGTGPGVKPHPDRAGRARWLTPAMQAFYTDLAALGVVTTVEAWRNSELVGGLYGVWIRGRVFTAESMFHTAPNASKHLLWALTEALAELAPPSILDAQTPSPHLLRWGAECVSRREFLKFLDRS